MTDPDHHTTRSKHMQRISVRPYAWNRGKPTATPGALVDLAERHEQEESA